MNNYGSDKKTAQQAKSDAQKIGKLNLKLWSMIM